ncbi:hypothetical protein [uncultured Ezakiella sp.]|uniref:hypothetical protein n=1 Tax=uncultured Ezakiella sp. TaxID=1637529 RepID=UPI0025F1CC1D|nr:hypothetical protein [uncultured Ezakiella sp.]
MKRKNIIIILTLVVLAMTLSACATKEEALIENFIKDYYAYIGRVKYDEYHELAAKELAYGDESVLKKYLDEKTVKILVADVDYLNPVYEKLDAGLATVKMEEIKQVEPGVYTVKYHLHFSNNHELKESHQLKLAIDGDKIIIKSGSMGPTKELMENLIK